MKYDDDIPELGEFILPYPKNSAQDISLYNCNNGIIIEIEGLDGSGKSSQTKLLFEKLKENYDKVYYVNFIHSEYMRNILLKTKWENCDPYTFTFMYMMGLANVYHTEILPRLDKGFIILVDRYIYTIISKAIVSGIEINWIEECLKVFKQPDFKIFIDTDEKICLQRKKIDNKILSYWECGGNIFKLEKMRYEYDSQVFEEHFLKYQSMIRRIFKEELFDKEWFIFNGDTKKENLHTQIYNSIYKKINMKGEY